MSAARGRWDVIATMVHRGVLEDTFRLHEVVAGPKARRVSLLSCAPPGAEVGHDGPHSKYIKWIIYTKLLGGICFMIGSVAFAYQMVAAAWLWYARAGVIVWIPGCLAYLVAPLSWTLSGKSSLSGKISDALQIAAMMFFIVGSAVYCVGDQDVVSRRMYLINDLFLVGSLLLFADAAKTSYSAALSAGLAADNVLDLAATATFVAAALLCGGFLRTTPDFIHEGFCCWCIGSAMCLVAPTRELCIQLSPKSPAAERGQEQFPQAGSNLLVHVARSSRSYGAGPQLLERERLDV